MVERFSSLKGNNVIFFILCLLSIDVSGLYNAAFSLQSVGGCSEIIEILIDPYQEF